MAIDRANKVRRGVVAAAAIALGGCSANGAAADVGVQPEDGAIDASFDAGNTGETDDGSIVHIDGGGFDSSDGGDTAAWFNPLCGVRHCDPDDPVICTSLPHDAGADADASDTGDTGGDVAILDGGSDAGTDAIKSEVAGSGTTSACRVVDNGGSIASVCAPAGIAAEPDFCASDADCKPGLACAGNGTLGQCLAYCCDSVSASDGCAAGHYCTSLASFANRSQQVPVCATLDECTLLASPDGCGSGSTCTVVTDSGDTACVPVGSGVEGETCPCAAGYVCTGASDARQCRKLCRVDGDCAPEECQPLPSIPVGFGLCAPKG